MSAELRCKLSWDQLLYARSRVVHAAAGAGLDAIDGPFMDLEDPKGNIEQAILARDLGFSGKGSIHPKQVNDLNKVFTPSEDKIAKAKKITKIFEEANTGLVMVDGKLIEKPVLREMYRTLAISDENEWSMGQKTLKELLKEANSSIQSISPNKAMDLVGNSEFIFIDLRDKSELLKSGKIPGALSCPRGMLEFFIDSRSPNHKEIFTQKKNFIFYCAANIHYSW